MQTDELGIVTSARVKAALFAARHPHLERRIKGQRPVFLNAQETHITVDCRTGARSFERICPPVEIVVEKPVRPVRVAASEPPAPFHDHWRTPEGKHALAMSERVDALAQRVKVGDIMRAVSEVAGISMGQLCGVSRERKYSHPRHIAMLLVREFRPDLSLPKVGFLFGNRDHTTVMHAERESRQRIETSLEHRHWYDAARASLLDQYGQPEHHKGAT